MACVSASMPASARTVCGQPSVRSGSTTARAGRMWWLSVLTLIWFALSVSTAAWDTSLPVPAVVGTQTSGSTGPGTRSKPKYSLAAPPWVTRTAIIFARSMLLPPPNATMASGWHWRMLRRLNRRLQRRFRFSPIKQIHVDPGLAERRQQCRRKAGGDQVPIGNQYGATDRLA